MKLLLAPMEGLMDHYLRRIICQVGGVDRITSEFVRVTESVLPRKTFLKQVPELSAPVHPAGIRVQLLGHSPQWMAENAVRAADMGSSGIDLNFGCPSKTVNQRHSGAALLRETEKLFDIVSTVRKALPESCPLSAKMRLGFEDTLLAIDNAQALAAAGADEITVHGRTRRQGYTPPADWEYIAKIREAVRVNIVANGDIFSVDDFHRCRDISGCQDVMIGRGIVWQPDLARQIKFSVSGKDYQPMTWEELTPLIKEFWFSMQGEVLPRYMAGRIKQWLNFLRKSYSGAEMLFGEIRHESDPEAISRIIREIS